MSIAGERRADKREFVEIVGELQEFVRRAAAEGGTLRDVEQGIFDRLLRLGHACTEQFISLQGDGDLGKTVTDDDGRTLHRSQEPVRRPLRTIFGEHEFPQFVYRERRHPHTPIVFRPVDARMGLASGRWSPLLEEFSQLLCIDEAYAIGARSFERIFRQRLSVDTLEEVNRRMGAQAAEFLDGLAPPPAREEGELLVLTGDGKGVPMVQADADRLRCFEERAARPGNRRMATLAGVYSVDRHVRTPEDIVAALFRDLREQPDRGRDRPEPCHKRIVARFAQVFEDGDERVSISGPIVALSWAEREVQQRRRPGQKLVCLMDGQHSLWEAAETCLLEYIPSSERIDILDILHVASYVWRAAKAFHSHREHQEAFARERLLRILQGDVQGVVRGLRQRATRSGLGGNARQEIDTVCGYFTAHAHRMRYDEYLAAGCPIATGVIEGACRHLVKDRMERSGMRWTQPNAQAMLDLRALHQSSYWDEFHQHRVAKQQASNRPFRNLLPSCATLTG